MENDNKLFVKSLIKSLWICLAVIGFIFGFYLHQINNIYQSQYLCMYFNPQNITHNQSVAVLSSECAPRWEWYYAISPKLTQSQLNNLKPMR
jgi:hypothetical protein